MSLAEDFEEFLDVNQGFAIEAVVMPCVGSPYRVKGIFGSEYMDIDAGMAGFTGRPTLFEGSEKSLETVRYGDFLQANGIDYRITAIRPDGTGWVKLELERQE